MNVVARPGARRRTATRPTTSCATTSSTSAVVWLDDPDNNRAPGNTCLAATRTSRAAAVGRGHRAGLRRLRHRDAGQPGSVPAQGTGSRLPPGRPPPLTARPAHRRLSVTAAVIRRAAQGNSENRPRNQAALDVSHDTALPQRRRLVCRRPPAETRSTVPRGRLPATVRECLHNIRAAVDKFQNDPWATNTRGIGGEGWRAQDRRHRIAVASTRCPTTRSTRCDAPPSPTAIPTPSPRRRRHPRGLHRDPWPDEWADRLEPRYREWIAEAEQYDFDGSRS